MRLLLTALMFSITLVASLRDVYGGGFEEETRRVGEPRDGVRYESVHLPLSAKSARAWITLRETMVKPPPDQTSFADVIKSLRDATRGKDAKTPPLMIYVDPTSLQEKEITKSTPVTSPFLGKDEVSLHTYLKFVLKAFALSHRVHDGLVVIDSPCCDCPSPVEVSAAEAWAWLLLQEEHPLRFPNETSIEDVVKSIQRGTEGKGPRGGGLTFHFDAAGLQAAEKTRNSPVTIEMEQVPLCTSLGLVLNQLGLGFHIGEDGVVVITHFTVAEEALLMDQTEAVEGYQLIRYDLFYEKQNHGAARVETNGPMRPRPDCPCRTPVNGKSNDRPDAPVGVHRGSGAGLQSSTASSAR